jgi:ABC-type metal ion transport system, periplasmic component/surface adhesin
MLSKIIFSIVIAGSVAHAADSKIKVVTTLPDVAEIVRDIGADSVEVNSLLKGTEDPHYAEARPDLILKVNRADIVCSMGLDLEIGWLPKVLEKSGNAKVQTGGTGDCVLGRTVKAIDIPTGVIDRSLGDVHPHGNPHFILSPLKDAEAADEVLRVLSQVLPAQKAEFEKRTTNFKARMKALYEKNQALAKKTPVMEYHKEFSYFFNAYGIQSLGSIEEKPGMPPSAARIAQVAKLAKEKGVKVVFATPSAPHKVLEKFQEISGIPVKVIPSYVQTSGDAQSIEALQKKLIDSL